MDGTVLTIHILDRSNLDLHDVAPSLAVRTVGVTLFSDTTKL